jgi:hypothetical protein
MGRQLERAVLRALTHGEGERFTFKAGARALLERALKEDLEGPDRLDSVLCALRLAAAFDGSMRSPSAAAELRAVLRTDARVHRLLKNEVIDEKPIDRMRSFLRSEGREVMMRAPVFGARDKGETSWPKS